MKRQNFEFESAVIFSAQDIRTDFIGCVAATIDNYEEAVILVENRNNGIKRIAEIKCTYESGNEEWQAQVHEDVAQEYGVDGELTGTMLKIAATLKSELDVDTSRAIGAASLIISNFRVTQK